MPTETKKKRILLVNEYSQVKSGFGTYGNQIMNRLYDTGKYELAEFASATKINDKHDGNVRWMLYANAVTKDHPQINQYNEHPQNQFGKWRFDRVLLDFKPDIVFDIRDFWMLSFEADTPLRRFFHWAIMPTVDSAPQDDDWIDYFIDADAVFTYTDWGKKVLAKQGGGQINLVGTASPGVELDVFKPVVDKIEHRKKFGFGPKAFIVGSVMRNQKRKLFPDLIDAFALYLKKCKENGNDELARNSYLYLHTSYPDTAGWNFPQILKNSGISSKVLFTYVCAECSHFFPSNFQDARSICPRCKNASAILSNVQVGLNRTNLAEIFGCFDLYAQYAICEGFGMSQAEAGACGVPIMSVDYSAMEDVVDKLQGYPVPVERFFLELETQAFRAWPDNQACANSIYHHATLQKHLQEKKGIQTRKLTEQYYDYDNIAKTWENYFDSVVLKGQQGKWDSPPQMIGAPAPLGENLSNSQLVDYCYEEILKRPDLVNSYERMGYLKSINLTYQIISGRMAHAAFKRELLIDIFNNKVKLHNNLEKARCGIEPMPELDYIQYAHLKKQLQNQV